MQLQLFATDEEPVATARRSSSWLAQPLTREERHRCGRLYAENIQLVRWLGHRLTRKYQQMRREDVYSCIDVAFLKAFRAWDPERGKLSTILERFARGECCHWIRDHNFGLTAPGHVRELGRKARRLIDWGVPPAQAARELGVTTDKLREALVATSGTDHETRDWALHECQRPTPWELLSDEP